MYFIRALTRFVYNMYTEHVSRWPGDKRLKDDDLVYAVIYAAKLQTISEFNQAACDMSEDDIIFTSKDNPRWERLNTVIKRVPGSDATLSAFNKFARLVAVGNAFMSRGG